MMNEIESTNDHRYPDWLATSYKEEELNQVLLDRTTGPVHTLPTELLVDEEVHFYHSNANVVSVRRLGYNDHGPVHARLVTYNTLKILRLLNEGNVPTSLKKDEVAGFE